MVNAVSKVQWTIQSLLYWVHHKFRDLEFSTPRLDAEILLSHGLNLSRIALYTNYTRPLSDKELDTLRNLVKRRINKEPIAYIIEQKEFYSLPFFVSPAVLIPRPETETLVDLAIHFIKSRATDHQALSLLDVGTGSGAIALAIKHELPHLTVQAVDKSAQALLVAQKNASLLSLDVEFLESDLFSSVKSPFDCIVSNPPYIPSDKISSLSQEVQKEPHSALDGGTDGLELIQKIISQAKDFLKPHGLLCLECGDDQSSSIEQFFKQQGYQDIQITHDLAKIPRFISGIWP